MHLPTTQLTGTHIILEPVTPAHREELRAALDCDPDNWAIQSISAQGEHFDAYWRLMTEAPDALAFLVRDRATGRAAGTSRFYAIDPAHRTLEIGYTWFRPEYRGTAVNPEAKLLMLGHAFAAGAERVAFAVSAANARSQAAMAKLGAAREGVLRRHKITWTGFKRDTVVFSIIAEEWPAVRAGLEARLAAYAAAGEQAPSEQERASGL
jgi:RimJ/RimL family protein N-acetyltransferase